MHYKRKIFLRNSNIHICSRLHHNVTKAFAIELMLEMLFFKCTLHEHQHFTYNIYYTINISFLNYLEIDGRLRWMFIKITMAKYYWNNCLKFGETFLPVGNTFHVKLWKSLTQPITRALFTNWLIIFFVHDTNLYELPAGICLFSYTDII